MRRDSAQRAGRGILSITGSKLYFLVVGYASQLLLPRLLGSPEAFGLFSAALSFVSIVNNVLIGASVQVVSKRVSEAPERASSTLRQALEVQLALGLLLSGALFASAPTLASKVLLDPLLTPLFRLSAAIVLAYALYTAFVGTLNGRQDFLTQARFDMGYTTLRTLGMVGAAALGFGALGVFYGFALASWSVLVLAACVVGLGKRGERAPVSSWLRFMAPLWLYQLCLNLMMQVDVTLLKRTVAAILQADGTDFARAAETASRYVGFYRAAETFAFVPYQLILAVALVIFPMVSEALSLGDEAAAARYIRTALRFSLLFLLLLAAPMAGAAQGVLRLVYPVAYAQGTGALAVLVMAMVFFALFVLGATIMTGAGKPSLAAAVGLGGVAVLIAGNIGLVRYVGVGEHTLMAAALGTGAGTLVAMVAIGYTVHARFGAFIPTLTALRSIVAGVVAFCVSRALLGSSAWRTLLALAAGALAYACMLLIMRELTREDLAQVTRLARRKRS
jgi:stage V sporulation protein B